MATTGFCESQFWIIYLECFKVQPISLELAVVVHKLQGVILEHVGRGYTSGGDQTKGEFQATGGH